MLEKHFLRLKAEQKVHKIIYYSSLTMNRLLISNENLLPFFKMLSILSWLW